jgi:hypothetical protein
MRHEPWTHIAILAATMAAICGLGAGRAFGQPEVTARAAMVARRAGGAAPAGGASKTAVSGVHIPAGKTISFDHTLTDGAGYTWNIQSYVNVGQGTNNCYAGAMYLHINGSNPNPRGQGWTNEAGDEIESGPMSGPLSGLNISRRVKVYKDVGLARWLEIFENTTSQPITFTSRTYICFNWNVGKTTTNSGAGQVGEKDWAFVTETSAGPGNNVPSTLHVFGDKRSKLRPRVILQGNQLYLDYAMTVPAGATVLLCHFESQNASVDTLAKDMQNFKASKYLRDLPGRVRSLIANFPASVAGLDVELERSESADSILLADDDPIYGTIQNESYPVQTLLGALTLPAEQVIGMVALPGEDDTVRYVLADGQVISGVSSGAKIAVGLPSGGKLEIPLAKIKSWSYRISKKRPEDIASTGPTVVLRTGDQLTFDPAGTKLALHTQYGPVEMKGEELLEIVLDNGGNAVHRAMFVNGSRLAGILEPEKITLSLKLGQKIDVPRDLIARIRFSAEEKPDDGLTQAILGNEDEMWGTLADANLTIQTQYGTVDLKPDTIKAFTFTPSQPGRAALLLWDGTVLRGTLKQQELTYRISPGPLLKVPVSHFTAIVRSKILPPDDVRKQVEKLVAMLGAESFKDRQKATEELVKMGSAIVPLLQKYAADDDAEVRQRIGEILEKLGAKPDATPAASPFLRGDVIRLGG